jgi:hypothetical protein
MAALPAPVKMMGAEGFGNPVLGFAMAEQGSVAGSRSKPESEQNRTGWLNTRGKLKFGLRRGGGIAAGV